MHRKIAAVSAVVVAGLLGGCNWLPVTPEGSQIRLESSAQAVRQCEHKGTVNVTVKDRFGVMKRGADIVAEEAETLARNDAARMNGNTIVAETPLQDGRQQYGVYACRR
jgi:hypothetical protein